MDIKEIETLIKLVSGSELTEFELEEGNMKVTLKKEKEVMVVSGASARAAPAAIPAPAAAVPVSKVSGETADPSLFGEPDEVVTAPLVGTFYAARAEGEEPFIKVGDKIKKGQTIGIIEAMKLMNEISATCDGVVEEILVENEDLVEYGQVIVKVSK